MFVSLVTKIFNRCSLIYGQFFFFFFFCNKQYVREDPMLVWPLVHACNVPATAIIHSQVSLSVPVTRVTIEHHMRWTCPATVSVVSVSLNVSHIN